MIDKKIRILFFLGIFLWISSCQEESTVKQISLAGEWLFAMDSLNHGFEEEWYNRELTEKINLPGSMAENGKGNDVSLETHWTGNMWNDSLWYTSPKMAKYRQPGNVKVSFWLSPVKTYYGPAWYQKKISIPADWQNQDLHLHLERPHWETTVWIDNKKVGTENYLATPHVFRLPEHLAPGEHTLTIRIDNRIKDINVGRDAHSISDNTQTNWNGMVGDLYLAAKPKVQLAGIKITPQVSEKSIMVRVVTDNVSGLSQKGQLILQVNDKHAKKGSLPPLTKQIELGERDTFVLEYAMGPNPKLWDEFYPNLYQLDVTLDTDLGTDQQTSTFGMREFKLTDKHFTINGRPVFLRGTLECAIFPLTGYPPTDSGEWKRILRIIQDHGLNHMRFHSWCPPEAAFQAADELGVYVQVEASAWATIGDGEPIDQWIYKEAEAIIEAYGNHPSFVMMAYGNEPSGDQHQEYLEKFVDHMKKLDDRRLYTSGAGWPYLDNLDYYNHKGPRIQGWAEELNSVINARPPQTVFDYDDLIQKTPMPYVSHEMGQWCAYPNFAEMSKYTGVLKPKNFEIYQESLEDNQMGHLADSFLLASGKLQTLCYKADIEAALRTKGFAGFQLLDLHDFPGQGTALVGILDAFWEEKGYTSPEEFRAFCSQTVPLARLEKRTFTNTETLHVPVEVAHYGPEPITGGIPAWRISGPDEEILYTGEFAPVDIPIGNGTRLGAIKVDLNTIKEAQKLTLTVSVAGRQNHWPLWVYPASLPDPGPGEDLPTFTAPSQAMYQHLQSGGKAILSVDKKDLKPEAGGDIGIGFSSIFWNTSWTKGQKPHTLGILCNPGHPALAHFPTEYHSNWQWWDAMSHGASIVLDDFSPALKPIVRVIDDWNENRRTALVFEVSVGRGKLLIAGIDLTDNLENRPEARQILYSLRQYMTGESFNPEISVDFAQIQALFTNT